MFAADHVFKGFCRKDFEDLGGIMAKKCVVCTDCSYNVMKQLVKMNELLWHIDGYIKDSKRAKHKECQAVFEQIMDDNIKNANALKELLEGKACRHKL